MKALVLAAGGGTRLKPVTDYVQKCMIPFFGKPFLAYSLENLCNFFSEIAIVVNHRMDDIKGCFGESFMGSSVHFIHQKNLSGTGGAVLEAEEFLGGHDYLLLLADVFVTRNLIEKISGMDGNILTVTKVHDGENHNGIALEESRVKAVKCRSDYVDVGLYKLTPAFTQTLRDLNQCREENLRGELRLMQGFRKLIEDGETVGYQVLPAPWVQTGDHEGVGGVLAVKDFLREYLRRGADFENSSVDCEAEDSEIINSVVFGPGKIIDCRIENSLVYAGKDLEGLSICDTLKALA